MVSHVKAAASKQLIHPPSFLPEAVQYEVMGGSVSYGVSSDSSDADIIGWCIPDKTIVFPHLAGEIEGFGRQKKRFEVWQEHHVKDPSALGGKGREYDFTIYNVVHYFSLLLENNPNMVDTLFVPERCILHMTPIAEIVRSRRTLFLHKGGFHKFKGYAHSQLSKMVNKEYQAIAQQVRDLEDLLGVDHATTLEEAKSLGMEILVNKDNPELVVSLPKSAHWKRYIEFYQQGMAKTKRFYSVKQFGFDVKFAYHIIRLMDEAEQILTLHDLDLERAKEMMKAVRRGEWTVEQIQEWFLRQEKALEQTYLDSSLRHSPDEPAVKALLLDILEQHFGNLSSVVVRQDRADVAINEILETLKRGGYSC
jgi:uncharacterized protein